MKQLLFLLPVLLLAVFAGDSHAQGPHYKLRQVNSVMGMKSETTIYVKGKRKRTEAAGMMGMPPQPVVIEQCDLQRYVKLNDKKKLYFIEPFGKDDVIDDDVKTAIVKTKPATAVKTEKGGVIYMWYNISDTGERKKMNGFTARHVWTTQKIKPSPDACMMKDSMIIKTDGWYIDLPEFNCPVRYSGTTSTPKQKYEPTCKDRFESHRSGKGKLGFPLTETRTIIMGNGSAQKTEMSTTLETLEFSTPKLDSMLFEIPPGYKLAASEEELQDKMDMAEMMNQYKNMAKENSGAQTAATDEKKIGSKRIGVLEPKGDNQLQTADLQNYLAGILSNENIEAVVLSSADDAKNYSCDYILSTEFVRIKSGSKVGGLLKAIKNTDPNAASSFNIEATMTLTSVADGSTKSQPKLSGKYDGKVDEAAKKALDEGGRMLLKGLK